MNTPPVKNALGRLRFHSAESGAGEQFLPLNCWAKTRAEGVLVHGHRYQTRAAQPPLDAPIRPLSLLRALILFWSSLWSSSLKLFDSTLGIDSRKTDFEHGFNKCLHTLRGTFVLLIPQKHRCSKDNNIASRETEVCLASAVYS